MDFDTQSLGIWSTPYPVQFEFMVMHSETTQRVTANLGEADSTESGRNQQRPLEEEKPLLTESQEEGGGSGYMWAQEESHTVRGSRPGGQAPQIGTTSQASTRVFKTH